MNTFEREVLGVETLSDEKLALVSKLAQQMQHLTALRAETEEKLKDVKERLRQVQEESLPQAMLDLGFESITLEDGSKISVGMEYYAEIPKARAQEAFAWLRAHNYDSLIKNEVKAMFGKGEDEQATALIGFVAEQGIDVSVKQAVHPQTLRAFVREKAEAGSPVPDDLFGVFIRRIAKLTNRS